MSLLRKLGLSRRSRPPVIVVSGLPRSGTSMMMNMLQAAGLELVTDQLRTADQDNPKGYFEDERVKSLDKLKDKSWLGQCGGKVIKVISYLLKDLPAKYHYKIIFMHRDLIEVIASQNKMLKHRGAEADQTEDQKMIQQFQLHLRKVAVILQETANFDYIDVQYREILEDPRGQAHRVAQFLGMPLEVDRMVQPVDESLYRNRT